MRIGIIGCGRVGTSLGILLSEKHNVAFYSLLYHDALYAASKAHSPVCENIEDLVLYSDIVFITVPDGKIGQVWNEIKHIAEDKIICHTSGAMTAQEAFPEAEKSVSIHPVGAVSTKETDLQSLFFTVEGQCADEMISLLKEHNIKCARLDSEKKALYHLSSVMGSNAVVALLQIAIEGYMQCGLTKEEAMYALEKLAKGNVENVFSYGIENALTGPVERNDIITVKKHLDCLLDKNLYKLLTKEILNIAKKKNKNTDYSEMEEMLK